MQKHNTAPVTPVVFLFEEGEPLAVFPQSQKGTRSVQVYSPQDKHAVATPEYLRSLPPADRSQYVTLFRELKEIGYSLTIKSDLP